MSSYYELYYSPLVGDDDILKKSKGNIPNTSDNLSFVNNFLGKVTLSLTYQRSIAYIYNSDTQVACLMVSGKRKAKDRRGFHYHQLMLHELPDVDGEYDFDFFKTIINQKFLTHDEIHYRDAETSLMELSSGERLEILSTSLEIKNKHFVAYVLNILIHSDEPVFIALQGTGDDFEKYLRSALTQIFSAIPKLLRPHLGYAVIYDPMDIQRLAANARIFFIPEELVSDNHLPYYQFEDRSRIASVGTEDWMKKYLNKSYRQREYAYGSHADVIKSKTLSEAFQAIQVSLMPKRTITRLEELISLYKSNPDATDRLNTFEQQLYAPNKTALQLFWDWTQQSNDSTYSQQRNEIEKYNILGGMLVNFEEHKTWIEDEFKRFDEALSELVDKFKSTHTPESEKDVSIDVGKLNQPESQSFQDKGELRNAQVIKKNNLENENLKGNTLTEKSLAFDTRVQSLESDVKKLISDLSKKQDEHTIGHDLDGSGNGLKWWGIGLGCISLVWVALLTFIPNFMSTAVPATQTFSPQEMPSVVNPNAALDIRLDIISNRLDTLEVLLASLELPSNEDPDDYQLDRQPDSFDDNRPDLEVTENSTISTMVASHPFPTASGAIINATNFSHLITLDFLEVLFLAVEENLGVAISRDPSTPLDPFNHSRLQQSIQELQTQNGLPNLSGDIDYATWVVIFPALHD